MSTPHSFPRTFGAYELLAELGRGTTGVVYQARQHIPLHRIVAIKFPGDGPSARAYDEALILANLTWNLDPNLVTLHEVGRHEGQVYFAREFVDGSDLVGRLQSRAITLGEVARVVMTIARVVERIHALRVVHRNLQASNILIGGDGAPKLIGFGYAMRYPGPNDAPTNVATDVHALGRMIVNAATELAVPLPEVLEAITMKCEAAGTDWGYKSAGEVAVALERYDRDK